jgi:hypothetical protein
MVFASSGTSRAATIAYDTFDTYADLQVLNGASGGAGWSSNWAAPNETGTGVVYNRYRVQSPGYDGSVRRIDHLRSAGSRLSYVDWVDTRSARRDIAASPASNIYYVGFHFMQTGSVGLDSKNNLFEMQLTTSDNRYLRFGAEGSNLFIETRVSDTTLVRSVDTNNLIANNTVYQVVMKIEQDAGGATGSGSGTAERVSIFLNPGTGAEPLTADFVQINGASILYSPGQWFKNLRIWSDHYNGQSVSVDQLRIATTFAEAVIPEPTMAGVLGAAALAIVRRRKR